MWRYVAMANIYKIDSIGNSTAIAHHHNGQQYKVRCINRIENNVCTLYFDKHDLRELRKLPVPSVTLAPPSILTTIPYIDTTPSMYRKFAKQQRLLGIQAANESLERYAKAKELKP